MNNPRSGIIRDHGFCLVIRYLNSTRFFLKNYQADSSFFIKNKYKNNIVNKMKVINIDIFNHAIQLLREEITYYILYFINKLKNHPTKQELKDYVDEKTYYFDLEYISVKFKKIHNEETAKYMIHPQKCSDAYIMLKPNSTFDNLYNKKDEYYLTIGRHKAPRGFYPYNDKRIYQTTYTVDNEEISYTYFHAWILPDGRIFYTENNDLESDTICYFTNYVWENAPDEKWLRKRINSVDRNTISLQDILNNWENEHHEALPIEEIKRIRKYDFQGYIKYNQTGCNYSGNQPIYPVKLSDCLIYITDGRFLTWDEAKDLGNVYKIVDGHEYRKSPITEFNWFIVIPWTAVQLIGREIDLTSWKYCINHRDECLSHTTLEEAVGRNIPYNPFILTYSDSNVNLYVGCKYLIYLTNENNEICSNKINIKISSNLSNINYKEY